MPAALKDAVAVAAFHAPANTSSACAQVRGLSQSAAELRRKHEELVTGHGESDEKMEALRASIAADAQRAAAEKEAEGDTTASSLEALASRVSLVEKVHPTPYS